MRAYSRVLTTFKASRPGGCDNSTQGAKRIFVLFTNTRVHRGLRIICLAIGCGLTFAMASAQPEGGMLLRTAPDIERAAARGDTDGLKWAVVAAIAEAPGSVIEIIRNAVALAPRYRKEIIAAATDAFPAFSDAIVQAVAPKEPVARGIEPVAEPSREARVSKWSGELEVGGSRTTGNTETEQFNAAFKIVNERRRWTNKFGFTYDFAKDDGNITARRFVGNSEAQYDFTERAYALGFGQYVDDRFSGFDYEATEMVGLGYRLIKSSTLTLNADAGPGFRQSKFSDTGKTENDIIGRARATLKWKISDTAMLTNHVTVTVGSDRTTTEDTVALTLGIIENVSGRLSFNIRHNSDPPGNTESTDTLTKGSLVYGF